MKRPSGVPTGCAPQLQPDQGIRLKKVRGLWGINIWKMDISEYVYFVVENPLFLMMPFMLQRGHL